MAGPIYIAGPTAAGKSAVALIVAQRLGGEIISVDSMQVYRGMDIGTAKPTLQERSAVPHHLIDVVDVTEPFDAAKFVVLARAAQQEINGRGRIAIFCGGTGLYFNALVGGLVPGAESNPKMRQGIEGLSLEELLAELREKDPAGFEKIDRLNRRRVVRAVEIIRNTGQPYSEARAGWAGIQPSGQWVGLELDRADLNERINQRVDRMFERGLVEETRRLMRCGLGQNQTALQAIGYRQVIEYLEGVRDLESTVALVKQKTRQYAKRQMTWFRRQLTLEWLDVSGRTAEQLADRIIQRVSGRV